MNLTDFGFIMRNRIAYGINAVSQRLIEKLQDEKLDKIIVEATTSVTDYLVSPYTLLSALPFGDSSLRLGDGSIFVHKDEMIESTMIVVFNNGIRTYGLAVDSQTAEVTALVDQGSWTLNQVGFSVNDIYNPSYWVDTDPNLKSSLTTLSNKVEYISSTNLTYSSSTKLVKTISFSKIVKSASVMMLEVNGTPYPQVSRLTISGLNSNTLGITAWGSGFVSGHVLAVSVIAIH